MITKRSKFENKVRQFANKCGYKVVNIEFANPYDDIVEAHVTLNTPFNYNNNKLRRKEFMFTSKMHHEFDVYVDFE